MGMNIDPESKELLRYISRDFVMLTANGEQRAYHIESGDIFGQKGFVKYCSKHYGELTMYKDDGSEERASSGAIWWTWEDPLQRVARRVVMEPTSKPELEGNPEVFNLWYERKKTMCPPDLNAKLESIELFVRHLLYLADGDEVVVRYFLNWLAQLYQKPEIKIPSGFLMYSKFGGVGKSILFKLLAQVFGPCMVGTCSGRALTKSFDDVIEHKRLLFINEMARSEKADGYENFKNMISEEQVSFEGKGRAAKDIVNITHYIVTTNNLGALPLMQNDRRVAVFMCNAERKPDAYYRELLAWMGKDGPGPSLVAGVLAQWKFDADWDPYAPVPQTAAAKAMQDASQGELFELVKELEDDRRSPFDKDIIIVDDVVKPLNSLYELKHPANRTTLGKVLTARHGEPRQRRVMKGGKEERPRTYLIRNVEFWEKAAPELRGEHLLTGTRAALVQVQPDEVANHE